MLLRTLHVRPISVLAAFALIVSAAGVAFLLFNRGDTQNQQRANAARAAALAETGLPGAFLAEYRRSTPPGWAVTISPLEAQTLKVIEAPEPLDLGLQGGALVSPDGKRMALSGWESHPGEAFLIAPAGAITIFDVEGWRPVASFETTDGVSPAGWNEDGPLLYAARNFCAAPASEGACPGGWKRELWILDVEQPADPLVVPLDFESGRWHFHQDRAVTLGVRTDTCCGIDPQGEPFVTVVNVRSGEIEAEIEISGMLIGQPGHLLGDTTMYASYHPATALSADGSRLYVVDPVEDSVRVVDLETLTAGAPIDFGEKRSSLSRFGSWLASQVIGTAHAKGNPTYSRQAQVTPDGRYLVISGTQAHEEETEDANRRWTDRPAGLVVIDLETMEVVLREPDVAWLNLSPDGRRVLATGYYYDETLMDEDGLGGLVAFGLKVIDLQSLDVVAHLWPDAEVSLAALSPDSRYAYVRSDGPGLEALRRTPPPKPECGPDCWLVHVVDLQSGEVIATRPLSENEGIISLVSLH